MILRLRPCGNSLARVLRRRWFPFLISATGGSLLPLRPSDHAQAYILSDPRVQTALQRFYELAKRETGHQN